MTSNRMTTTSTEELKQALIKDFNELLVKEFTADWNAQRLITRLNIEVMSLDNLEQLIEQYVASKVREARIEESRISNRIADKNADSHSGSVGTRNGLRKRYYALQQKAGDAN